MVTRMVLRSRSPSLPNSPTVADAATMLWMEMGLPPAPPTACATTIDSGGTPIWTPVENWNCEKVRFDTVFEPATNAPSAPTHGAMSGHDPPEIAAAPSARVTGMLESPEAFSSGPDWMRTVSYTH